MNKMEQATDVLVLLGWFVFGYVVAFIFANWLAGIV